MVRLSVGEAYRMFQGNNWNGKAMVNQDEAQKDTSSSCSPNPTSHCLSWHLPAQEH